MRTAALFCRNARRLSSVASQGRAARPVMNYGPLATAGRVDSCVKSGGAGDALMQFSAVWRAGTARFMAYGNFNEEHANTAVLGENEDEVNHDEHPEETIEKASHELFRQSNAFVDTEDADVEEFQVKELGREKPGADIAREVWGAKEQNGTSVFSDESDKAASEV